MKNETNILIPIRKLKLKQKSPSYFIILLFFLILISINSISKPKRNLFNYDSEIHLVVQGSGRKSFLSEDYNGVEPYKVILNGKDIINCCSYGFIGYKNNITLIFDIQIEDCENMFMNLGNIIGIDLSHFDASKVTNMISMFDGCSNLENIKFGNINTSSVKYMKYLFYGCQSLKSIDLSNLDFSNVIIMDSMFEYCTDLKSINMSNLKTSSVESMAYFFSDCYLNSYDLSQLDLSHVTDISGMFWGDKNIKNFSFEIMNVPSVENMRSLFCDCSNLISVDFSNRFFSCEKYDTDVRILLKFTKG